MEYKISRDDLKRIAVAASFIGAKCDALDNVLGDTFSEYMGRELTAITDIILDVIGVPDDTTVALGSDKGFCRDWFDEQINICDTDDAQINIDDDPGYIQDKINLGFSRIAD